MTTRTLVRAACLAVPLTLLALVGAARAEDDDDDRPDSADTGGDSADTGDGGDKADTAASDAGDTAPAAAPAAKDDTSPSASDVIVFPDGSEEQLEDVTIKNWTASGWKLGSWRSVEAGAMKITDPAVPRDPSVIVLHETGDDRAVLGYAKIHFFVDRAGIVYQTAPMSRRYAHAPLVRRSIGIEIANGAGGKNCPAAAAVDTLTVKWRGCNGTKLAIPSAVQFESVYQLVELLARKYDVPRSIANATLSPGEFLVSAQGVDLGGSDADPRTLRGHLDAYRGVITHSILPAPEGRNDGGLPALYVYYRWSGKSAAYAYCRVRQAATSEPVKPSTTRWKFKNADSLTWLLPTDLNEEENDCAGQ